MDNMETTRQLKTSDNGHVEEVWYDEETNDVTDDMIDDNNKKSPQHISVMTSLKFVLMIVSPQLELQLKASMYL